MSDYDDEDEMTSLQKALMGKTLTGHTLPPGGETITFHTTTGDVRLRAEGDCCSYSWVESIDDPSVLSGLVTGVEQIAMPDLGTLPGRDVVSYYGLKITTERGRAVIDYRNDSNGYYGGSLEVDNS